MRKIKIELIVIVILAIMATISIADNGYISLNFEIGLVGLAVSTILCLKKLYRFTFYLLTVLLIFSVFDLIWFSAHRVFIGTGTFKMNLISLLLLAVLCIARRDTLLSLFDAEVVDENVTRMQKIGFYKREFARLPIEQLRQKVNDVKLTEEARAAAKELLEVNVEIDASANSHRDENTRNPDIF